MRNYRERDQWTPMHWVAHRQRELERKRGFPGDIGPQYDGWLCWVELMLRSGKLNNGSRLRDVAECIAACLGPDGKPVEERIGKTVRASPQTVRKHIASLTALGMVVSRLGSWPHPCPESVSQRADIDGLAPRPIDRALKAVGNGGRTLSRLGAERQVNPAT